MEFKRVARSGQVQEGTVRRFFAGEHEFAVARLDGKAYATSNYCTHLDCLLSSGKLVDDGIGCSCHGVRPGNRRTDLPAGHRTHQDLPGSGTRR